MALRCAEEPEALEHHQVFDLWVRECVREYCVAVLEIPRVADAFASQFTPHRVRPIDLEI